MRKTIQLRNICYVMLVYIESPSIKFNFLRIAKTLQPFRSIFKRFVLTYELDFIKGTAIPDFLDTLCDKHPGSTPVCKVQNHISARIHN